MTFRNKLKPFRNRSKLGHGRINSRATQQYNMRPIFVPFTGQNDVRNWSEHAITCIWSKLQHNEHAYCDMLGDRNFRGSDSRGPF